MLSFSWATSASTFFSFQFSYNCFNICFFNIYTSPTFFLPYLFISLLFLQPFSFPYLFMSSLPSTLISFFLFPFIFIYFCLFLFSPCYYEFVTISSILCIAESSKVCWKHKSLFRSPTLKLRLGCFYTNLILSVE